MLRRNVALVAGLALLLHALMPVLMPTRAVAAGSSAEWVEVCTGGKVQLVRATALQVDVASAAETRDGVVGTALDDCTFCSHQGMATVPSESGREAPDVLVRQPGPGVAFDLLDPYFSWAAAHTRSPPSLN